MLEAAVKTGVVDALGKIVGREFASTHQSDLYIYSQDMTQAEPSWPDIVVLPKSAEEIQAIMRLANKEKIPVTPYIAGGNIGGLTIPLKGGIVLDLKRMDRILEVSETDMYAVIEPGVTFGHMKAYLEKHHPNLVYTYAFSPPSTGVLSNALAQGLDSLSYRYGAASNWVSGLEVVLPTGEVVKIGSCAVSNTWQAFVPFPELAGLFLGWQGTTGVVTKMAVSLWPKPKYATAVTSLLMDLESAYELLRALSRTRIPDDIVGISFPFAQMEELARESQVKVSLYPAKARGPDDPEYIITAEITGHTENELNAKVEVIEKVVREELKDVKLIGPQASPSTNALLPMQMLGVLCSGGGLTWVGTYGPMSNWLETAKKGCILQDKYGISRSCYTRVMNEGHFVALRWMIPFNKEDPEMVKRIQAMCSEQLEMVIDNGFIPYKTPFWAIRKLEERAGPTWVELHQRVKKMLDPNNIMNPGRWGAPRE
jgi:FAD/FMN-containing dehydrogenase